jgi:hypothetical protein
MVSRGEVNWKKSFNYIGVEVSRVIIWMLVAMVAFKDFPWIFKVEGHPYVSARGFCGKKEVKQG